MTQVVTTGIESYLAQYEKLGSRFRGDPSWMQEIRERAVAALRAKGFPSPRDEDWRHTPLSALTREPFALALPGPAGAVTDSQLADCGFGADEWTRIVLVDGIARRDLWANVLVPGLTVRGLADAIASEDPGLLSHLGMHVGPEHHAFVSLNSAFLRDGAYVEASAGAEIKQPVHILYVSTSPGRTACYPRNLVTVAAGASLTVIESYVSVVDGPYLTDSVTEVAVGEGGCVDFYRIQQESPRAYHVSALGVAQDTGSRFSCTTVNVGAELARNDVTVVLEGERSNTILNGLSVVDETRHVDNHTLIDHSAPSCESNELYKAVLDGKSRSVFSGKIIVRPGAQKTDARQTNRNLLLSGDATADTQPQLEIFADDVKCTHGATVGQLDDTEIFYLRSRGMSEDTARRLLTYGFANDVVARIQPDPLRLAMKRLMTESLHTSLPEDQE